MSDSGADTKSVSQALADFSEKFARFAADPQAVEGLKVESPLKTLQDQINERESERVSLLRRQFLEYACPMTSDIEEDEEVRKAAKASLQSAAFLEFRQNMLALPLFRYSLLSRPL